MSGKMLDYPDGRSQERRKVRGKILSALKKEDSAVRVLYKFFSEPVFLLLIGAAGLYFFLGESLMTAAVMLVFVVSWGRSASIRSGRRTGRSRRSNRSLSQKVTVVRGGKVVTLPSESSSPGDIIIVSGERIARTANCWKRQPDADESALT